MASVCLTPRNYQKQYQLQNAEMLQQQPMQHATHLHSYQTQPQMQQQQTNQHQVAATLHQLSYQRPSKFTKIAPSNNNNNNRKDLQHLQHLQQFKEFQDLQHLPNGQKTTRPAMAMMAKKGCPYGSLPFGEQLPSVARRNARERNRVKQVNNGFANLRQHLPQTVINALSNGGRGASKKLSKVDTLRIAVEYIRGLEQLLDNTNTTNYPTANSILQTDESSNDDSNYTTSSIGSPFDIQTYPQLSQSPTPSYSDSSDISVNGANSFVQPLKFEDVEQVTNLADDFKFDTFEEFQQLAVDEQPDDEELLDYISSWQDE